MWVTGAEKMQDSKSTIYAQKRQLTVSGVTGKSDTQQTASAAITISDQARELLELYSEKSMADTTGQLTIQEQMCQDRVIQKEADEQQEVSEESQLKWLQDMAERIQESQEKGDKGIQTQVKCMKIAMRLVAGDKVPYQDERYLLKNDPDLYMRSLKMRVPKRNPDEYDSVLDEEDREGLLEGDMGMKEMFARQSNGEIPGISSMQTAGDGTSVVNISSTE